jgi:hypothetical protein
MNNQRTLFTKISNAILATCLMLLSHQYYRAQETDGLNKLWLKQCQQGHCVFAREALGKPTGEALLIMFITSLSDKKLKGITLGLPDSYKKGDRFYLYFIEENSMDKERLSFNITDCNQGAEGCYINITDPKSMYEVYFAMLESSAIIVTDETLQFKQMLTIIGFDTLMNGYLSLESKINVAEQYPIAKTVRIIKQ